MSSELSPTARRLLTRWLQLEEGDALRRAINVRLVLIVVGAVLGAVVILGVVYGLHPALIAAAAFAAGWVTAERHALRARLAMWPTLREYIDWPRVRRDLSNDG